MQKLYLSDPLADLLERSGLSPKQVNMSLERQARLRYPTVLAPGHVYLRQIREHTGVNVVMISRRYRRLLVQIEQMKNGKWQWIYKERSQTDIEFACPADIPHTLEAALPGRPLNSLIDPTTPALGCLIIDACSRDRHGWLNPSIKPGWRAI
ncbi:MULTISPECIES: hypothetical protein [unclassified Sphingomonas]|uniref:hypothetical protein n=1 Tax=unclassified Sphingomonas TaxID=196159 RepID=UPI000836F73E|nr:MULTISPECIES: hypothetical protein [unclassified Sphingomonas]